MTVIKKNEQKRYKYIYGPVSSWRLGSSLGIDPVSQDQGKVCTFDCVYCQIGKTEQCISARKIFVPTKNIIEEIKNSPPLNIDYITFSGAGEPTLAKNLGDIIKEIKKIRKEKIAVLTNSSLITRTDVKRDLALADFVIAKLDAHSQDLFFRINRPMKTIRLTEIVRGLKEFKSYYKGKFALQIMFTKENIRFAGEIARLALTLNPDEVQINTPLRPSKSKPLSEKEIARIKKYFSAEDGSASGGRGMNIITVYGTKRKSAGPLNVGSTLRRRGETIESEK